MNEQEQRVAAIRWLKNSEREVTQFVRYLGVGERRLQLLRKSAWSGEYNKGQCWEICQAGAVWRVFRSDVYFERDDYFMLLRLKGWTELAGKSDQLRDWFAELCRMPIPLQPYLTEEECGRDCGFCQLALFGDCGSGLRLEWSDTSYPVAWQPVCQFAEAIMRQLERWPEIKTAS